MKKILVGFFLLLLITFGSIGFFVWRSMQDSSNTAMVTTDPSEQPIITEDLSTSGGTRSMPSSDPILFTVPAEQANNTQHQFTVTLLSSRYPAAFDLRLIYDPQTVEITKITAGNLWSETNVLKSVIDPVKGEIRFAGGQSFNTAPTLNRDMLTVSYTLLGNANGTLRLNSTDSFFAFTGGESAPITSEDLQITSN